MANREFAYDPHESLSHMAQTGGHAGGRFKGHSHHHRGVRDDPVGIVTAAEGVRGGFHSGTEILAEAGHRITHGVETVLNRGEDVIINSVAGVTSSLGNITRMGALAVGKRRDSGLDVTAEGLRELADDEESESDEDVEYYEEPTRRVRHPQAPLDDRQLRSSRTNEHVIASAGRIDEHTQRLFDAQQQRDEALHRVRALNTMTTFAEGRVPRSSEAGVSEMVNPPRAPTVRGTGGLFGMKKSSAVKRTEAPVAAEPAAAPKPSATRINPSQATVRDALVIIRRAHEKSKAAIPDRE